MSDFKITKIAIKDFKRIENLSLDLAPITVLVGGNTSGKSSVLQAVQLATSLLQSAYRPRPRSAANIVGSVSDDQVSFRPTHKLVDLRRGRPATERDGFDIILSGEMHEEDEVVHKTMSLFVRRGRNANISLRRDGDNDFALMIANPENNASVFTPGLSGISTREELKTRGALSSSVMQGDANTYLRSLLYHLFHDETDRSEENSDEWENADRNGASIAKLPECKWKRFCLLLDEVYEGARLHISHDEDTDQYIEIIVNYQKQKMPIDLASTGMLQVIQILAYSCFFEPPLLLLDEPDAHLHADSQTKLLSALQGLSARLNIRILLTSHSPQLIQKMNRQNGVQVVWMDGGAKVELDGNNLPAIPLMMSLGALGIGAEAFAPEKTTILLTEDKNAELVKIYATANGGGNEVAILSYNGCNNLQGARQLAVLLHDLRPEAQIIIHRDRDYRTEQELQFEKSLFESWLSAEGASQIVEVFTDLNDIEHKFVSIDHLHAVFPEIEVNELQECIDDAISEKRDDFVSSLDRARRVISERLYTSRMKGKTDKWREAGMPDNSPPARNFRPTNGNDPFPFKKCHGKELEKRIRDKLHSLVGGDSATLKAQLHTRSDALKDENWKTAIAAVPISTYSAICA